MRECPNSTRRRYVPRVAAPRNSRRGFFLFDFAKQAADKASGGLTGGVLDVIGLPSGGGGFTVARDGVQPPMRNPVLAYVERLGVSSYSRMSVDDRKRAFKSAFQAGRFRNDRWLTSLGDDGKLDRELKAWTDLAEIQGGFKGNMGSFPGAFQLPATESSPTNGSPTPTIGQQTESFPNSVLEQLNNAIDSVIQRPATLVGRAAGDATASRLQTTVLLVGVGLVVVVGGVLVFTRR